MQVLELYVFYLLVYANYLHDFVLFTYNIIICL
jgi:hypothetical protein